MGISNSYIGSDGQMAAGVRADRWQKLYRTVVGAAVAQIDFTGLDLISYGRINVFGYWINPDAGAPHTLNVELNGDSTAANYDGEQLYIAAGAATPGHLDQPAVVQTGASGTAMLDAWLIQVTGKTPRFQVWGNGYNTGSLESRYVSGEKSDATTNVTSLQLRIDGGGNHIGIGSIFSVTAYKV
jgi:hypothetical protein